MAANSLELVKLVNGTRISNGKNRTTFSDVPLLPEICRWNDTKCRVPFTLQPEFPESLVDGKRPLSPVNGGRNSNLYLNSGLPLLW